eukprot:SAG31_NODE_1343_length_8700_cov_1.967911_4_plen_216_part_00
MWFSLTGTVGDGLCPAGRVVCRVTESFGSEDVRLVNIIRRAVQSSDTVIFSMPCPLESAAFEHLPPDASRRLSYDSRCRPVSMLPGLVWKEDGNSLVPLYPDGASYTEMIDHQSDAWRAHLLFCCIVCAYNSITVVFKFPFQAVFLAKVLPLRIIHRQAGGFIIASPALMRKVKSDLSCWVQWRCEPGRVTTRLQRGSRRRGYDICRQLCATCHS